LITAAVSLIFSMLFVVYSTNTAASGFAVYEPFVYLASVLLLGVPVYLVNRSRMTPPPPPPADSGL
jgi:APA family basic amino acid/polyamine antiporter